MSKIKICPDQLLSSTQCNSTHAQNDNFLEGVDVDVVYVDIKLKYNQFCLGVRIFVQPEYVVNIFNYIF